MSVVLVPSTHQLYPHRSTASVQSTIHTPTSIHLPIPLTASRSPYSITSIDVEWSTPHLRTRSSTHSPPLPSSSPYPLISSTYSNGLTVTSKLCEYTSFEGIGSGRGWGTSPGSYIERTTLPALWGCMMSVGEGYVTGVILGFIFTHLLYGGQRKRMAVSGSGAVGHGEARGGARPRISRTLTRGSGWMDWVWQMYGWMNGGGRVSRWIWVSVLWSVWGGGLAAIDTLHGKWDDVILQNRQGEAIHPVNKHLP